MSDPLLTPLTVAGVTIRNRIFSTSHTPGYAEDGLATDRYLLYHREKARGGIGLTMIGGSTNVAPDSPSIWGQLYAGDDAVIPGLADLADAVDGARREAGAAFGDDTLFLERWLTSSRHVEIQILGDLHGNLVHLFERECSIQRRHQKIIEEAPSPAVNEDLRARMGEAALSAARKLSYASAGTVEFLLDGEDFWFLEIGRAHV